MIRIHKDNYHKDNTLMRTLYRPYCIFLIGSLVSFSVFPQTLEEVIQTSLETNLRVENQVLARDSARLDLENAAAAMRPSINIRGSMSYLSNPPEGVSIEEGSLGSTTVPGSQFPAPVPDSEIELVPGAENSFFRLTAGISQPIYTWNKLKNARKAAELQLHSSSLQEQETRREIIRDVRQSWSAVKMLSASSGIVTEMQELASGMLEDNRARYDQGLVNWQAVLDARSNVSSIITRRTEIDQALASARLGLEISSGISSSRLSPVFTPSRLERAAEPGDDGETAGEYHTRILSNQISEERQRRLLIQLRENNSELQNIAVQRQLAEVQKDIQAAGRPFRPDIGLQADIELSGQRIPFSPNWRETWDLGITLSIGVDMLALDWGQADNSYAQAGYQLQQAQNGESLTLDALEARLSNIIQQINLAVARYLEARSKLALQEEQFKNAEVSFENELITREELQGSRLLLLGARLEALSYNFEYETSMAELDFLTGKDVE